MVVTYWGVRGSMPSPGRHTVRYGGNTACVTVENKELVLVIDAGTGIRELGKRLKGNGKKIILVLSHLHYDHVLGFPLFAPLFEEGREISLVASRRDGTSWTPLDLMDGVHWPVTPAELKAKCNVLETDPEDRLEQFGIELQRIPVNHPGGAYGFRISDGERVFVHVSDNELYPPGEPTTHFEDMVEFCKGVDILSHDAQYLENEMPHKEGWGHSLAVTTCRLAIEAGVGQLILFHHDPDRTDVALDRLGSMAAEELRPHGIPCTVAYEGLSINLTDMDKPARNP